jgi:hypothetical protein
MADLRYPIGKFQAPASISAEELNAALDALASLPHELSTAVGGLSDEQLDTPYREGGWTVRQVVHHVADSHINSYVRFRLALTEEVPTVKPYQEALWAELPDANSAPVSVSLCLLGCLHDRLVRMLRAIKPEDWKREYRHPQFENTRTLDETTLLYAWHGRHHLAHITELAKRNSWDSRA